MLAALFIQGGIAALKAPQGHVQAAKPVLDAVAPAVDKAVEVAPIEQRPDDEMLVKIDAGVKIVAGSMLALGKFPRLASTALAASLIPTTLAGHRFWEETDPQRKTEQQIHFLKNVGLLGGLLIAAADTEGRPSLAWQGKRAARRASAKLSDLTDNTSDLGERLSGTAQDAAARVSGVAQGTAERVSGVAQGASGAVSGIAAGLVGAAPGAGAAVSARASRAGEVLSAKAAQAGDVLSARASDVSEEVGRRAAKAAKRTEKRRAAWEKQADKRRAELLKRTAKQRKQLAKQASRKRAELVKAAPGVIDNLTTQAAALGHDVAERASVVGHELAHQAEGAAKDARKRVHALTAS